MNKELILEFLNNETPYKWYFYEVIGGLLVFITTNKYYYMLCNLHEKRFKCCDNFKRDVSNITDITTNEFFKWKRKQKLNKLSG